MLGHGSVITSSAGAVLHLVPGGVDQGRGDAGQRAGGRTGLGRGHARAAG